MLNIFEAARAVDRILSEYMYLERIGYVKLGRQVKAVVFRDTLTGKRFEVGAEELALFAGRKEGV